MCEGDAPNLANVAKHPLCMAGPRGGSFSKTGYHNEHPLHRENPPLCVGAASCYHRKNTRIQQPRRGPFVTKQGGLQCKTSSIPPLPEPSPGTVMPHPTCSEKGSLRPKISLTKAPGSIFLKSGSKTHSTIRVGLRQGLKRARTVNARGSTEVPHLCPQPQHWRTHSYTVRSQLVNLLIERFRSGVPEVDCFASAQNGRFERFWSTAHSAWEKSFSGYGLLWMNPPSSGLRRWSTRSSMTG